MILDELKQAERYYNLHAGLQAGFEFLRSHDLLSLDCGRHEIDGDRVFALINRDPGRGRGGARLEAHRKYIDIQYLVDGTETIGWRPTSSCETLTDEYVEERDIMFFGDEPATWIVLPVQKFMIFFPDDAHAPLASTGDNVKAVIKVAV